jgi:hypothetical protein
VSDVQVIVNVPLPVMPLNFCVPPTNDHLPLKVGEAPPSTSYFANTCDPSATEELRLAG